MSALCLPGPCLLEGENQVRDQIASRSSQEFIKSKRNYTWKSPGRLAGNSVRGYECLLRLHAEAIHAILGLLPLCLSPALSFLSHPCAAPCQDLDACCIHCLNLMLGACSSVNLPIYQSSPQWKIIQQSNSPFSCYL